MIKQSNMISEKEPSITEDDNFENSSESDSNNESITISSQSSNERININEDLDEVLDRLGHFGRFQKLVYFSLWLPACGMAAGAYASLYMEWSPTFICMDEGYTAELSKDSCFRSDNETMCENFAYDSSMFESSIVTEFDLVCDRSYLQTVSKTVYMLGMLVGSLAFGWFGDRFGRRLAFLLSSVFLVLGSIACALSFNIQSYITFRFITSCGGMGLFITCFVIALEFVGPKARTACGVAMQFPFAIGQLYIIFIGYFIRDWRLHQAILAATFLVFPLYLFFIPESIRWLLSRKRNDSAGKILNRVARFNKVDLPMVQVNEEVDTKKDDLKQPSEITSIFLQPKLRLRFLVMALNWTVTTMGYYGLGLSSTGLTADPFISMALSAAMEIPGYLFCVFTLDIFGRKKILAFSQMLTGSTCIIAALLPATMRPLIITLTLVGKFGASAAFSIVYVYTAEMFHTPVRNSAIGLCSTSARIGGLLAPTIASLSATDPLLPFMIMGCCCCLGGAAVLVLPETCGHSLPDTVEEALDIGKKKTHFRNNISTGDDLLSKKNQSIE